MEKFWAPVAGNAPDYNVFNTSAYAAAFAIAAAYIGYPLLDRLEVELDRGFFISISPFVFLGGAVRVLEDLGLVDSFILVTPFIYLVIFGFTAASLILAKKLEKSTGRNGNIFLGSIGLASLIGLSGYLLSVASLSRPVTLITAIGIFSGIAIVAYLLVDSFFPSLLTYSFFIPVAAHYWDASTSFVAIRNGASEKHVLADFFIQVFGPGGMFLMKTMIIVPAVYYICDSDIERREKSYYLFLIAVLGIALGTRNILSIAFN